MRTHLLTTAAAAALLAAVPAYAQDATWSQTPSSGNFNTAANWNPPTVPTGTAFFGASNVTSCRSRPIQRLADLRSTPERRHTPLQCRVLFRSPSAARASAAATSPSSIMDS